MIGYLRGNVHSVALDAVILDVSGVGYSVLLPNSLLSKITSGDSLNLWIHTHVREDALVLFGFETKDELEFFKQLLSVSGVGPKLGMTIMSTSSHMVKDAIVSGDEAMLSRIPGIGKKTAARIIIDLKGKVTLSVEHKPRAIRQGLDDAVAALINLGYDRGMILNALGSAPTEISTTEEMVKYFLKNA